MTTKVFLRADGHNKIGLGHIVRSLALAKMLQQDFDCYFLVQEPGEAIVRMVNEAGCTLIRLKANTDLEQEAHLITDRYLTGQEIVVLDGYHFTTTYQEILRKSACKLVCIDDIHQTHFVADVLINHTSGIKTSAYSAATHTQFHLGLAYALLRQPFLKAARQKKRNPPTGETVAFICMGGADPINATLRTLQSCEKKASIQSCNVVIGSAYMHLASLEAFKQQSRLQINLYGNLSADKMVELMSTCDLAICPPSTVSLEYLCVGHKLYLFQTADNQSHLYQYLIHQGLALGWEDFVGDKRELQPFTAIDASELDGYSDKRLLKIFRQLDYDLHCRFRQARPDDMLQYWTWANDPETRMQSFQKDPIKLEDHRQWYQQQLDDPKIMLYILEYKNQPIGQVRFSVNGFALLNYSIAPAFRGRSLGTHMLRGAIQRLQTDLQEPINVIGYVKKENEASNRALTRLGFQKVAHEKEEHSFKYLLKAD